ncbi:unnamed protein product [Heligmosomoides polygyrus]|uniref:Transposase n=1 Tax=Heligmosomoides polygyrus TaxID=6339 RepID=A0A3P7Y9Q5_HELPZ|nr:unnamed protein product [Heligmosomoides polygyrus]
MSHEAANFPAERDKEATLANFSDYEKYRVTILNQFTFCKEPRYHMESAVTMEHIPEYLTTNADGSRFLQFQTDDMHIYFLEKVIRKACQNGLDTLVADGIFSMHPNQREKNGQLYTIHGVCNGKYPAAEIRLRRKDMRRREKVNREIGRFRRKVSEPGLTDRDVEKYCRRMARYGSSSVDVPNSGETGPGHAKLQIGAASDVQHDE